MSKAKFVLPDDLETYCARLAAAGELQRLEEVREEAERLAISRQIAEQERRERPIRIDCAQTIFAWLLEFEKSGARQKLAVASGEKLVNPWAFTDGQGHPCHGYSGSYTVKILLTGEIGLVLSQRLGPCWGRTQQLCSVEALADAIPTGICVQLARELTSDRIWESLKKALAVSR